MKNYYIKQAVVLTFISVFFSFEARGMYEQEVLDYSGSSLIMRRGQRVGSLVNMPDILTVDQIDDELKDEDLANITKLDLSKNYMDDNSVPKILKLVQNNLPNIKILDLSFNNITEEGLHYFTPFLLQDNFLYLDIVGNTGAASIDGIRNLVSAFNKQPLIPSRSYTYNEQISIFLSKVIWLPESYLKSQNTRNNVSKVQIESHKNYYKYYQKIM